MPWSEEAADGEAKSSVVKPKPEPKPRFKITTKRWRDHGATPGCPACDLCDTSGVTPHSPACRKRYAELVAKERQSNVKYMSKKEIAAAEAAEAVACPDPITAPGDATGDDPPAPNTADREPASTTAEDYMLPGIHESAGKEMFDVLTTPIEEDGEDEPGSVA